MGSHRAWPAGCVLIAAIANAGCPAPASQVGESCAGSGDCVVGLQCLAEVCAPLCGRDAECGDGYRCQADGRCLVVSAELGDPCRREVDCAPGQACVLDPEDTDSDGRLAATCQPDRPGAVTGDTCAADTDCRNQNCVLGRCTQLCIGDPDCPPTTGCVTIPRPLGAAAPEFAGCLPRTGTLRTTIPMASAHQTVLVPVPSHALSFALTARIADENQLVGATRVVSPSGALLYATPFSPEEFYQNPLRHQPTRTLSTLLVPNTPAIELEVGAYQMELGSFFEAGGNGTAIPELTVDYKLSPAATLDLHLVFLNLDDHPCSAALDGRLDAAAAQAPGGFRSEYLPELGRIFAAAGITVGDLTYTDIGNRPDLDGLDAADLAALLRLAGDPDGITVFFVRSISPVGVLALAGGNPGPPRMPGTGASGVVVATDTLCYRDWTVVARATAHEICRYLGLFRNREPDGADDPIPDSSPTPDNLMYFSEDSGGTELSPGQRFVLSLNPLLR